MAQRIDPQQAHEHLFADNGAMLVCAYDSEEKFEKNHLKGAIPLDEFQERTDDLAKDREIIFYCA